MTFGWGYPPGVTGGEYQIAGPDYEHEIDTPCPECGRLDLMQQGYRNQHWVVCGNCEHQHDIESDEKDQS